MPRICLTLLVLILALPASLIAQSSQHVIQLRAEDLMTREEYQRHIQRLRECKTEAEIKAYLEEHQQDLLLRAKNSKFQNNGSPKPSFYSDKHDKEFIRHE